VPVKIIAARNMQVLQKAFEKKKYKTEIGGEKEMFF